MPPLGAPARAEQAATLGRIGHELATAPRARLAARRAAGARGSLRPGVVRGERDPRRPARLREEATRSERAARRARREPARSGIVDWLEARAAGDFEIFRPNLERRLELIQRYADCFTPFDDPYDVLLDDHEPGMSTADVAAVFARLKEGLVPLVARARGAGRRRAIRGDFPVERQRALLARGSLAVGDGRPVVAARRHGASVRDEPVGVGHPSDHALRRGRPDGILSCLHEFGHGLYERQVDPRYSAHAARGRRCPRRSTSRRAACGRTSSAAASRRGASSIRGCRRSSRSSSRTIPLASSTARSTASRRE